MSLHLNHIYVNKIEQRPGGETLNQKNTETWPEQQVPLWTETMPASYFFSQSSLCVNHFHTLFLRPLPSYSPEFSTFFAAERPAYFLMRLVEESSSLREPCALRWVGGTIRRQAVTSGGSAGNKRRGGAGFFFLLHSQLSTNQSLKWIPAHCKLETTRDTADLCSHSQLEESSTLPNDAPNWCRTRRGINSSDTCLGPGCGFILMHSTTVSWGSLHAERFHGNPQSWLSHSLSGNVTFCSSPMFTHH